LEFEFLHPTNKTPETYKKIKDTTKKYINSIDKQGLIMIEGEYIFLVER
jgi:hypothetical protein